MPSAAQFDGVVIWDPNMFLGLNPQEGGSLGV